MIDEKDLGGDPPENEELAPEAEAPEPETPEAPAPEPEGGEEPAEPAGDEGEPARKPKQSAGDRIAELTREWRSEQRRNRAMQEAHERMARELDDQKKWREEFESGHRERRKAEIDEARARLRAEKRAAFERGDYDALESADDKLARLARAAEDNERLPRKAEPEKPDPARRQLELQQQEFVAHVVPRYGQDREYTEAVSTADTELAEELSAGGINYNGTPIAPGHPLYWDILQERLYERGLTRATPRTGYLNAIAEMNKPKAPKPNPGPTPALGGGAAGASRPRDETAAMPAAQVAVVRKYFGDDTPENRREYLAMLKDRGR